MTPTHPGPTEPDDGEGQRLKLVANEKAKLSATYVNGAAIALLAVGALGPVFGALPPDAGSGSLRTASGLVCLACSALLHAVARSLLTKLR